MSLIAEAMRQHFVPTFIDVRGTSDLRLDDLIGTRSAFYPSFDTATSIWTFEFGSATVSAFLANECSRFACAAFQSFISVPDDISESDKVPWALIQAYYAAFYAGHSILRAVGNTCTYIDGGRAAILRQILGLYGFSQGFDGGTYETSRVATGASMSFAVCRERKGSAHEMFWAIFSRKLEAIETAVLTGPLPTQQAQEIWSRLGELRATFAGDGTRDSWLSVVRNSVQYRHESRIWFPHAASVRDRATLRRVALGWRDDPLRIPLDSRSDLQRFLASCTFLVALCRVLMVKLDELGRRDRSRSFLERGPIRFLATRQCM
jgi:hypothetical protein